jgi:hypothetical protein
MGIPKASSLKKNRVREPVAYILQLRRDGRFFVREQKTIENFGDT